MNPRDDERGARAVAGGNRFAFASIVRERADAIARGAAPRIVTMSTKPVTIAIQESARGLIDIEPAADLTPMHVVPAAYAEKLGDSQFRIECRDCGARATVQRRPGVPKQGRPPTRCAACGISPNWEQIA